jgi:hypothetical protein
MYWWRTMNQAVGGHFRGCYQDVCRRQRIESRAHGRCPKLGARRGEIMFIPHAEIEIGVGRR